MASIFHHFEEFTLTYDEILEAAVGFTIFLLCICIVAKLTITETKRLAWIVSIVNSFVMAVVGIFYVAGMRFVSTLDLIVLS